MPDDHEVREVVYQINDHSEHVRIVVEMDLPEGKGTIVLQSCVYGLELWLPGVSKQAPVALIDTFYNSPACLSECPEGGPYQIIVHSPNQADDPVGRVRFYPNGTRIDFELDAVRVHTDAQGRVRTFALDRPGPGETVEYGFHVPESDGAEGKTACSPTHFVEAMPPGAEDAVFWTVAAPGLTMDDVEIAFARAGWSVACITEYDEAGEGEGEQKEVEVHIDRDDERLPTIHLVSS